MPWTVSSDVDVVCLCSTEGSTVDKKLMTVADTVCHITKTRGTTEAAMVDHDMAPMTKARGGPNIPYKEPHKRLWFVLVRCPSAAEPFHSLNRWLDPRQRYCNFATASPPARKPMPSSRSQWKRRSMCGIPSLEVASPTTKHCRVLKILALCGRQGFQIAPSCRGVHIFRETLIGEDYCCSSCPYHPSEAKVLSQMRYDRESPNGSALEIGGILMCPDAIA